MNKSLVRIATGIGAAMVVNALCVSFAHAQERREGRGEERRFEERFASPHWVFDARHNHGHYYPSVGYAVGALPGTRIGVVFGGRQLFFNAGVWFEPARGGYVVVAPPVGVIAPILPPAYVAILVNGVTYYYANETYYAPVRGGYAVVAPPPGVAPVAQSLPSFPPAVPQSATAPAAAPPSGVWYYCESAKAYYPYVAQCAEGWKTVPATPAPAR